MDALNRFASPVLVLVAAVGFFGLNGVFLFYALARPEVMIDALANPISVVFMLEAFLLMGFLAWLIARTGIRTPSWRLFVVLSLVGSLAFSVPAFVLLLRRKQQPLVSTDAALS